MKRTTFANVSRLTVALACIASATAFTPVKNGVTFATTSTQLTATWSDTKAVRDYQAFLASGKQTIELSKDMPSVIIAPEGSSDDETTKLAQAWQKMGRGKDVVITPGNDVPVSIDGENNEYPIYVTLPPYQVGEFLQNLPDTLKDKVEDFVFFSGGINYGNVEDVLKEKGFCRDSMTQVLISGMRITPLLTVQDQSVNLGLNANGEEKLAGQCITCGKWAGSVAERLQNNDVTCRTDFYREWRRHMWERNMYDSVFTLLGAVRDVPTTVNEVAMYYETDVSDIVWEFSQLLRGWRTVTLTYGFEERIYSLAEYQGNGQPCLANDEKMYPYLWGNPVYLESLAWTDYLYYAKTEKGLLSNIELPERSDDSYTSNMRQGNLRADGVV